MEDLLSSRDGKFRIIFVEGEHAARNLQGMLKRGCSH